MRVLLPVVALVICFGATAAAQPETPATGPVRAWPLTQHLGWHATYSLTWTHSPIPPNPPGSGPYWMYQHTGSSRYGQAACVTQWFASLSIPDHSFEPHTMPSKCTPSGYLSWFQPDTALTPLSLLGVAPFDFTWLPKIHPFNAIMPLNIVIPNVPGLVGVSFYIEGVWWNQGVLPVSGPPCGVIGTPLTGPFGSPTEITINL